MAVVKKISELTPKGSNLANTDLLIVGVDNGTDYDLKSITGAQVLGNVVSQTITDGATTTAPSENAVYDKFQTYQTLSTAQSSTAAIRFDKRFFHCSTGSNGELTGLTGNITVATSVATYVGTTSFLIHNDTLTPTFSSEFIKSQDSLDYKINVDNYIICTLINQNPAKVSYRIVRDSNDLRLITTAEGVILSNTSGTNTGDETITTIKSKLGITTLSGSNTGDQDLSTLVVKNTAITGATKTKITYDAKGLVTSGTDATTSDIADSLNKRYVTDANLTVIGNTSGTNTGDQIISDATLTTSDITTNNFTTSKHGFVPKGTNVGNYLKDDGTWGAISAGGLTYFTEAQSTASPNATVNVDSLTAVASTTNADFAIVSKGTGALTRQIPDGTATGGNKRGLNAVDLQTLRSTNTQVASGKGSFIAGWDNTASSDATIALGYNNNASGGGGSACIGYGNNASNDTAIAIGVVNNASGYRSVAIGLSNNSTNNMSISLGQSNTSNGGNSTAIGLGNISSGNTSFASGSNSTADSAYSTVMGYYAHSFGVNGRWVTGQANLVTGDAQKSTFVLSTNTTSTTATVLSVRGISALANNQLTLQNNNSIRFKGTIIGRQSGSTNTSAWDIDGIIQRGVGAGTTTLLISNVNVVQNTPAWGTPTLTANTTLGCLTVSVIGALTTNIQWTCVIDTTEVIYA